MPVADGLGEVVSCPVEDEVPCDYGRVFGELDVFLVDLCGCWLVALG